MTRPVILLTFLTHGTFSATFSIKFGLLDALHFLKGIIPINMHFIMSLASTRPRSTHGMRNMFLSIGSEDSDDLPNAGILLKVKDERRRFHEY